MFLFIRQVWVNEHESNVHFSCIKNQPLLLVLCSFGLKACFLGEMRATLFSETLKITRSIERTGFCLICLFYIEVSSLFRYKPLTGQSIIYVFVVSLLSTHSLPFSTNPFPLIFYPAQLHTT